MKYSDHPDYLRYGSCLAQDDYNGALQAITQCLADPSAQENLSQYADILQRKGYVYFMLGKKELAIECYKESEKIDPSSLLAPYFFAKFLAEKLEDYSAAINKCETIKSAATLAPSPESDEDFGGDWYIQRATELIDYCLNRLR